MPDNTGTTQPHVALAAEHWPRQRRDHCVDTDSRRVAENETVTTDANRGERVSRFLTRHELFEFLTSVRIAQCGHEYSQAISLGQQRIVIGIAEAAQRRRVEG